MFSGFRICLTLITLMCFSAQSLAQLPPLTVRTYHVPPWVVIDDQETHGIAMDDLRAFSKLLPFAITIEPFPWKRAENTSRAELPTPTALFPCTPVPERDKFFIYSKQFRTANTTLLAKDGVLPDGSISLQDFKKKRMSVAVREGHILLQDLKNHGIQYAKVGSISQLMNLLIRERVNALYDYDKVFDDYITQNPEQFNGIKLKQTVVSPITYGFCINRNSEHAKEYLKIINEARTQFQPPPH